MSSVGWDRPSPIVWFVAWLEVNVVCITCTSVAEIATCAQYWGGANWRRVAAHLQPAGIAPSGTRKPVATSSSQTPRVSIQSLYSTIE